MTVQRDYPDFSNAGDTGEDNVDAIQPITDGEGASQSTFRRPSENLRSRTEILRANVRDLNYYRDAAVYACSATAPLTWGGTVALAGTGILTNTGAVTVRPLLTPPTSTKGTLAIGVTGGGDNQVVYTVPAGVYASDGVNNISVEHRNGGVGATLSTVISGAPTHTVLVVFDAANTAHDSAAVAASVSAAIAADTGVGGLGVVPVKLTATDNGIAANTVAALAETRIEGTADQEAHLIPAASLTALTTATPLVEGDCIALWYRHVVEPVGGDALDPKVGQAGGRWESNPDRGNEVVTNNLFITSADPDKIPGAIPLCKVVNNELVWLDGSRFVAGAAAIFGMATDIALDTTGFAGANTVINNGGIPTTLASPQIQSAMDGIDDRLARLRGITYTCTDGTASIGGDFNGVSALDNAISALAGAGGTIYLRRGTYNLTGPTFAVPNNVTLLGEGSNKVTLDTATTVTLGSDAEMHNLTVDADLTVNAASDRGCIRHVKITGTFDLSGDYWDVENVVLSSAVLVVPGLFQGARNTVRNVFSVMPCALVGDQCRYENVSVGEATALTAGASLTLAGTNNTYVGLSAGVRDADFAATNAPIISVSGTGLDITNLVTDQTTGVLSAGRVGLKLNGAVRCTLRGVDITMKEGVALSVGSTTSSAACDATHVYASHFLNDAASATDTVVVLPVADDHTVSFTDCVFDVNEKTTHGVIAMTVSATSNQYFTYTRCRFVGGRLVGYAGDFVSSSFTNCDFQIKNPISGGVRLLGGLNSTQTSQIWNFSASVSGGMGCELTDCRFDMSDSEVEISGGQPQHSVALIARFKDSRARGTRVLRMNQHLYGESGAAGPGLFLLAGSAFLDGLEIAWTTTAAVGAGSSFLRSIINTTVDRNNHVENVLWDHTTGAAYANAPNATVFFSIDGTTDLHVRKVKLVNAITRLMQAFSGATATLDESTFTECQLGGLTQGLTTAEPLVQGDNNKFIDCTWYVSATTELVTLATSATYTNYLFEGCTFWQLGTNITTAQGMFDGNTSTMTNARFTGCYFYTDRTAGSRDFSQNVVWSPRCSGAGNIFYVVGGATSVAPAFSAIINAY